MSRPRRSITQKAKTPEKDNENEDDELDLSDASSGDFSSASSDEWDPSQTKSSINETMETESDASGSDEEVETESGPDSPIKNSKSKANRSIATLRGSIGNSIKRQLANKLISGNKSFQYVLEQAEFKKKKSITATGSREKTPDFDCSGGLKLSDSSDGSEDESVVKKPVENGKKATPSLIDSINQSSGSSVVDLRKIHDNLQEMENAKTKMMNYQSKKQSSSSQKENVNIADLLAMGEGSAADESSSSKKKSSQKRPRNTQKNEESDSDGGWEEVEEEEATNYKVPKEGVEIVFNNFNQQHAKKKDAKPVDLEAQMKRKLNRKMKELQMRLHKVSVAVWISHGNFVNRKLNDSNLMAGALALLPKNDNHCYPTDQTDIDYFQQITKWFKSAIKLRNTDMYCTLKQRPPLMMSLALQMKFKAAICRRDYVLIFVILLRAIGVQCRMVQSLVCAPILPPKSELLSLAAKKPTDKTKSKSSSANNSKSESSKSKSSSSSKSKSSSSSKASSSSKSKSSTSSSSSHSKSNDKKKSPEKSSRSSRSRSSRAKPQPLIPQLDGGDDLPTTSKAKKPLKIKALPGYQVDDSYIDVNKIENGNSKKKSSAPTKMPPKEKLSMDSPNRNAASPSEKLFKSKALPKALAKEQIFSPLKTRGIRKETTPQPGPSAEKVKKALKQAKTPETAPAKKVETTNKPMDTLQVFSPRRLRSRSRSAEPKTPQATTPIMKPSLKSLQKRSTSPGHPVSAKKVKFAPETKGSKRSAEDDAEVKAKKAKPNISKLNTEEKGDSDDSSKYFKETSKKKSIVKSPIDRRVLSSDSDCEAGPSGAALSPSKKSKGIDIWVEVYSEKDARWIAIDVFRGKVDCVKDIAKAATHPMVYVFAWNNDKSLKDVSARYCPNLNTTVRKMRVDNKYLNSVTLQFAGVKTARDRKEDEQLNSLQMEKPMPTSISEFKNHPLYALKRHLLKYEAIYPVEPPILGYIREEAIYPRDCVFVLHTRETWLKEARVVKINEQPYKMSKTMKWDNTTKKLLKDVPQELFGIWQTKEYEPPVAENGMVPRNAYGNVELFKPQMLPIGCVHLQLPGLNKVCKKLGIDCSQAIVGFDSNGGWPYPVYDGFIICEEFQEKVIDAWNREQEEQDKKDQEKYDKRVYGNWRKLIKGMLIRQRLKEKYNIEDK